MCVCGRVYACMYIWGSTVEFYKAVEKKELLAFVTAWMDLEIIMLGKISQSEKDKYHMISFICGI